MNSVLIVHNEPRIRRVLRESLLGTFSNTIEAGTAYEAVRALEKQRVDMVILDLVLPDSGAEAACRVVRERTTAPIIVLADRPSDIDKIVLLDTGASDYMAKPVSLITLRARVVAHLRRSLSGTESVFVHA